MYFPLHPTPYTLTPLFQVSPHKGGFPKEELPSACAANAESAG
ncbi:hypothetical protein [Nostoc sp. PA-18-2419]|nr:hypothetical protein [Nostoc sp. PA-18-2419]